jgi:alkylated DNA nucleotide flippase Atl1
MTRPSRRPDAPPDGRGDHDDLPAYARAVLDAVDRVPRGRVVTYGDVAELVGSGGPRQVAAVLARWVHETTWHRVLRADGTCAPEVAARQLILLRRERVAFKPGGDRVDLQEARWPGPERSARAATRPRR